MTGKHRSNSIKSLLTKIREGGYWKNKRPEFELEGTVISVKVLE